MTIKAHSRLVTITDGLHVKKDYWYVMPERNPDVYYVEIPRHPHTVTFTTDVESVSFQTTDGSRHDFVIELADGTKAHTQIRAEYRNLLQYRRTRGADKGSSDTIPFSLGHNDKIYVKGRINHGPELDVQVDLGAGGSLLVDNRNGKAYFHPNGRISDPFRNPEYYVVRVLLLAAGAGATVAAWFGRRPVRHNFASWNQLDGWLQPLAYLVSACAIAIHVAVPEIASRSGTDATNTVPPQI